jgi:hypothetical protein
VYGSSTPHILVVLKGGNEFAGDLARALRLRHALAGGALYKRPSGKGTRIITLCICFCAV